MLRNNSFLEQNTQRNVQYYKLGSELLQIDSIGREDEKAERNVLNNIGGLALGGVDRSRWLPQTRRGFVQWASSSDKVVVKGFQRKVLKLVSTGHGLWKLYTEGELAVIIYPKA